MIGLMPSGIVRVNYGVNNLAQITAFSQLQVGDIAIILQTNGGNSIAPPGTPSGWTSIATGASERIERGGDGNSSTARVAGRVSFKAVTAPDIASPLGFSGLWLVRNSNPEALPLTGLLIPGSSYATAGLKRPIGALNVTMNRAEGTVNGQAAPQTSSGSISSTRFNNGVITTASVLARISVWPGDFDGQTLNLIAPETDLGNVAIFGA